MHGWRRCAPRVQVHTVSVHRGTDTEREPDSHGRNRGWRKFQADVVAALVFDVERFLRRAEAYGFTQYADGIELDGVTSVYISVPPGAAPDAVKLLKSDRNIKSIEVAYIYTIDRD